MVTTSTRSVADRLDDVRRRVDAALAAAGRRPGDVRIVAVAKLHSAAAIREAVAAGQVDIGESRAQELTTKIPDLGAAPRWHFVGRLQRNKVTDVVGRVVLIHSVGSYKLGREISKRAEAAGICQDVLVQVNVGRDPAKGGCPPGEAPALLNALARLPAVRPTGLMTIPPLGTDPRPCFAELRALRDRLMSDHPTVKDLSMGMSADFESAILEGSTIVRVGEAVFGPRPAAA